MDQEWDLGGWPSVLSREGEAEMNAYNKNGDRQMFLIKSSIRRYCNYIHRTDSIRSRSSALPCKSRGSFGSAQSSSNPPFCLQNLKHVTKTSRLHCKKIDKFCNLAPWYSLQFYKLNQETSRLEKIRRSKLNESRLLWQYSIKKYRKALRRDKAA